MGAKLLALITGYLVRQDLKRLKDGMTLDELQSLLYLFSENSKRISEINQRLKVKTIRQQNFLPEISENIVKFIFFNKYGIMPNWDSKPGDLRLEKSDLQIEVKGFSSKGPTSFGPDEKWNWIYFLDATDYKELKFSVYEVRLSNQSETWKKIKINKHETFEEQCQAKRRPRIVFSSLQKQLGEHCKKIFTGHFDDIKRMYLKKNKMTTDVLEKTPPLKFIDLCAGTGAFSLVLEKKGCECVFANDILDSSEIIYRDNVRNPQIFLKKDLLKVELNDIPPHDILCAGFPCQAFSIAGNRKGFGDSRSNVYWKILEIICHYKPQIVLLENVKNLLSHDYKKTFGIIKSSLIEAGYFVKYKLIDSALLTGIPQHRERVYILAFRSESDAQSFDFEFALKNKPLSPISEYLESDIPNKYRYTPSLKCFDKLKECIIKDVAENVVYQYRRHYVRENKKNQCPTLTANMGAGGHNVPIIKQGDIIRKLTPRECFNLQGFSIDYKLSSNLSDSKLYQLVGNSVNPQVIEAIINRLRKSNIL